MCSFDFHGVHICTRPEGYAPGMWHWWASHLPSFPSSECHTASKRVQGRYVTRARCRLARPPSRGSLAYAPVWCPAPLPGKRGRRAPPTPGSAGWQCVWLCGGCTTLLPPKQTECHPRKRNYTTGVESRNAFAEKKTDPKTQFSLGGGWWRAPQQHGGASTESLRMPPRARTTHVHCATRCSLDETSGQSLKGRTPPYNMVPKRTP